MDVVRAGHPVNLDVLEVRIQHFYSGLVGPGAESDEQLATCSLGFNTFFVQEIFKVFRMTSVLNCNFW